MIKPSMALGLTFCLAIAGAVSPVAASSTANQPLLAISDEGGFIPQSMRLGAVPNLVAYANGTVITNEWQSARPDLILLNQRTAPVSMIKSKAKAIHGASATPKGGWGIPGVADVPDTRVQIWIPGIRTNLSVFALNFTNGANVTSAQAKARKSLAAAIASLTKSVQKLKSTKYKPIKYELWLLSDLVNAGGVGIANPASVFCASMGGSGKTVTTDAGERTDCVLPDGTVQDEWDYFRAVSPTLNQWPVAAKVPSAKCTAVAAAAFAKPLSAKNFTGKWLLESGQAISVLFRPVLPHETACKRK